ncbi:MAG: tRNA lysidine(34) synthetase TilS [Actinomycetes bacterium]
MDPHAQVAVGALPEGLARHELVAEVARALTDVPEGASVVVATSGGPDSTALSFLTAEARPDLVLVLAHVRHGLRDDRHDVATVESHASFLGVDLHVREVDVPEGGDGLEAEARARRYGALRRVAAEVGAGWTLTGHTAEDQAETVLLRLVRGTGVPGLAAIAPRRGGLVRPLLRVRRNDVRRFVVHEGLPAADDPMNDDERFLRTRARRLLPHLARLGPDPVGALCRLADLARMDAAALDARALEVARAGGVRRYGPGVALPDDVLVEADPAVATRLVRAAVQEVLAGGDPPAAAHVLAALALPAGAALDVPGAVVTRGGGWLAVVPDGLLPSRPVALAVPGRTPWLPAGVAVLATTSAVAAEGASGGDQLLLDLGGVWHPPSVEVDPRAVPPGGTPELGQVVLGPLPPVPVVRSRLPGDRITTTGGTRKLQDVLVDAGVPRALRDVVPLVAVADRVLWVPGVAADAELEAAGRHDPAVHLVVVPAR